MKARTFLFFYLTWVVLALAGIPLYQEESLPKLLEIIHIVVMLAVVSMGLYQAYQKIRAKRKGLPADDEFSLRILHRSAAVSYVISLYGWAAVIYLYVKTDIDSGILFGSGILCMVALFALSWLYYKIRGYKNA